LSAIHTCNEADRLVQLGLGSGANNAWFAATIVRPGSSGTPPQLETYNRFGGYLSIS